jgi:hypothetical protein
MVANEDQPVVEVAEVHVAPTANQGDSPVEHRLRICRLPRVTQ